MGTIQSSINQGIATSVFLANQAGVFDERKATKKIKNEEAVNEEIAEALNARKMKAEEEQSPESAEVVKKLDAMYDTRSGEYENSLREAATLAPKKFAQKYVNKAVEMALTRKELKADTEQYANYVGEENARMTITPPTEQEMAALRAQQRVEAQRSFVKSQNDLLNLIKEQSKGGSM